MLGGQNVAPGFKIYKFWYLYKNEKISAFTVDFNTFVKSITLLKKYISM